MKVIDLLQKSIFAIVMLPLAIVCGLGAMGLTIYLVEKAIFADPDKLKDVDNRLKEALRTLEKTEE